MSMESKKAFVLIDLQKIFQISLNLPKAYVDVDICGLYYKHVTIITYASSGVN